MIWPLLLTNLPCPCLELISNELSGWIFCCVRRAISNPFPTALKTRDAFQVWPVHVTGYTPHRPYSLTLEIPGALPALRRGTRSGSPCVQGCHTGLGGRCQTAKHRTEQAPQKRLKKNSEHTHLFVPRPAEISKTTLALPQPSLPWLCQQDNGINAEGHRCVKPCDKSQFSCFLSAIAFPVG